MNPATVSKLSTIIDPTSPVLISAPILLLVFKVLLLILVGLYVIYALVIVRQIGLMSRTINTTFESILKIIGWIHFFLSIAVFVVILMA